MGGDRPANAEGRDWPGNGTHPSRFAAARERPRERRTLTELEANLQDEKLKAGLQPYVIDGALGGLLDSRTTG